MEDFVRVFTAPSDGEAQLAKGLLEAEGIRVMLKGEGEGPYRMGPVQLWVPSGLEAQARLILDEVQRGEGAEGVAAEDASEDGPED